MNLIDHFVQSVNAKTDFNITVSNRQIVGATCCLRFLFIEIGSPNVESFIFIPDYTAEINNDTGSLIFRPNSGKGPSVTFANQNKQILNFWFTISSLSNASLDNFFQRVGRDALQNFSESSDGFTISLTGKRTLRAVDKDSREFVYIITEKTCLRFSEIGEPMRVGIFESDDADSVRWIVFPDVHQMFKWILLIKCAINSAKNSETEDISIEINEIDEVSSDRESEFRSEDTDNAVDLTPIDEQKQSFGMDHKRAVEEEVSKIMCDLEKKASLISSKQYHKSCAEIPEPVLEYPNLSYILSKEDNDQTVELSYRKNHSIGKEELNEIILSENQEAYINYQHYLPNFIESKLDLDFEYELNVEESIEYQYEYSSGENRCSILAAILLNGYKFNTFSMIFDIKKDEIIKEVFKIINKYKSIKTIIEVLSKQKLLSLYDYGAIIFDNAFINKIISSNKNIQIPKLIPTNIPFNFKLRPFKEILHCSYEFLYNLQMDSVETKEFIDCYANALYSYFSHYLVEGKTVQLFVKEIIQKRGPTSIIGDWSIFRINNNKDFNVLWNQFWNKSFKVSKLSPNFLEFFNYSQIIKSFYIPCSEMRNEKTIQNIANFLKLVDALKINKL